MKKLLKYTGLFLFVLLGMLVITQQKTSARIGLNPDPGAGALPGYIRDYFENADTQPMSPTVGSWITPSGSPSATEYTVPSGTRVINFDLYSAGVVGWSPSSTSRVDTNVVGQSAGISNITGMKNLIVFNPYHNSPGTYRQAGFSFQYTHPTAITSTTTIYMSVFVKNVNEFIRSNGTFLYRCVDNGAPANGPDDPNCPTQELVFSIRVNVSNSNPLGYLDSVTCSAITGWAFDWDNVAKNVDIHVYYGGEAGSGAPGIAYSAKTGPADGAGNGPAVDPLLEPGLYQYRYRPDVGAAYPGAGNNHGFQIPVPSAFKDGVARTVHVYAIGVNSSGANAGNNVKIGVGTLGPCSDPPVCGPLSLSTGAVEVNEPFNFTVSATPVVSGSTGFVAIRTADNGAATIAPGTNVPNGVASGGYDANGRRSFTNVSISQTGTYYARWTYNTPAGGSVVCSQPINVGTKPYLKVFGNDVKAGSGFISSSQSCALTSAYNQKASFLTFAKGSGSQWTGAGGQLAALALGEIDGFASSVTRSGSSSPPAPPKGLTFGNYYDTTSVYGGRGGQFGCMTDYYTTVSQKIGGNATIAGAVTLTGATDTGQFVRPTGTTLPIGATTITGKKALVVDGNVYISGNIAYGAYAGPTNMPSFYLIVRGNIYIAPGVTQLNGVYVAQPTSGGAGGNIYTCANNGSFIAAGSLRTSCGSQLTINGAFLANEVKFLRTTGTLQSSAQNEIWSSANIAEVFKSGPELYLSAPSVLQRTNTSSKTYDSITSLPPIF